VPISISSQVLGTLSVTVAETTGTLEVAVLATAPAVLSVELGTPGPAATVTVGSTTTLSAGSSATVTNSGSSLAAVLNFGIPRGDDGAEGPAGPTGPAGAGVVAGGTVGQSLLKVSATDYDTTWGTPSLASHSETTQATVRNSTGSTLTAGQIVYINGALGNRPTVALSKADSEATSAGTYAMVETAIPNNTDGTVITSGTVSALDTSALSDGDKLYLSPTTAGAWTTTKPSAPNHLVYIGTVTRSHPNQGTIQLRIQNGYELEELHNVAISSPANLDLLSYESSTSLWKNKSISTLGLATQAWVTSQGYLTSAPVSSVAGRTGAITLAVADVSGAAPLASPTFTGTPSLPTGTTAVTQTAGDNSTKVATTAFVTTAVSGAGGGGINVQTFGSSVSSGSFTWTKPANAKWVQFLLFGGGGGGGSGGRYATTSNRYGGGGGGGAGACFGYINASYLGSTETVVVGAGGSGGASVSVDTTVGSPGTIGGITSFSLFKSTGGNFGSGGTTTGGSGGTSTTSINFSNGFVNGAAGAGSLTTGGSGTTTSNIYPCSVGGGGGAGAAASSTAMAGGGAGAGLGTSATVSGLITAIAGGTAGNPAVPTPAGNGVSASSQYVVGGTGGGGGYYKTSTAGNAGGSGGWPGGGGGGGGAADNGFSSGAGGSGANGYAVIITYF
jgi:hypothetical protein